MGLKCQVFKKEDNTIERVEAPNGEPSVLYESAKQVLGNEEKALEVWAKAYTPEFLSYYGYWINPVVGEFYNTDSNGEPFLDDVIAYMKRNTYVMEPLAPKDIMDIRNLLISTNTPGIVSLNNNIHQNLYIDGNLVINEQNLRKTGLYNETEISRILSDPSTRAEVVSSMRKVMDFIGNIQDMRKQTYFLSIDDIYGPVIYKDGEFNSFGKKNIYNPSEIDEAIKNEVAGIRDEGGFNKAFMNLEASYPELVDRFVNDKEFASEVFDEYSTMSKIPVVTIEDGEPVKEKRRTLSKIQNYFHYNPARIGEARKRVSDFLNRPSSIGQDSVYRMLREIEESATWFGVDIIGLSDLYSNSPGRVEEIENVVLDLDIFIARRGDMGYAPTLASSIDDLLGDSRDRRVLRLPDYMTGMNIVYSESVLPARDMFESHSLLKIGENIYQDIRKEDLNSLYRVASVLAKSNFSYFPSGIYPSSCFKDGYLNKDKISNLSDSEMIESIRSYVLSNTDPENTEEMVMTRIAFGHDAIPAGRQINAGRELSRYMNKKYDYPGTVIPSRLYTGYLNNKFHKTKLYDNVYKYLDFASDGTLKLSLFDPHTLKTIELSSEGRLKSDLFDYAMSSTDISFSDLFYLDNVDPLYAGEDFKHHLYTTYPDLLKELGSKGNIEEHDDFIMAYGVYDEFIKKDGFVYMKIGEGSLGSTYQLLEGTESEVKYNSTQKAKKTDIDKNKVKELVSLKQSFDLSVEEKKNLGKLEC